MSTLRRMVMVAVAILAVMLMATASIAHAQVEKYTGPIIDMHLHAYMEDTYWGVGPDGAIPLRATGEPAPASAEEHRRATLEAMDRHGVVLGAVSGDVLAAAESWAERAPDRFLKGISVHDPATELDIETFVGWIEEGRLDVFAEIGAQYGGYSPSDPAFEPYWRVAEAHGVPVGIHTGESFSGQPYVECCPNFRLRLGDPLLLEDMLVAHPDLKVMVMHAGGWFYERTLQLMQMYPHVYAEVGVLGHAKTHLSTETLTRFLERAKAFGVLDRVMFGSDQMVWPEAVGVSIEAIQSLDLSDRETFVNAYFSPEGDRLALALREDGVGPIDLWVHALPDGPRTRLTYEGARFPAWSLDGRHVLFARDDGVYRVRADAASPPERVIATEGIGWLQPTPGGEIVFEHRAGAHFDVGVASPGDDEIRLLVEGPANEEDPDVSSDGRWLAYESDESGRNEVYVMPFGEVGRGQRISVAGGNNPLWSRSDPTLFFRNGQDELEQVRIGPGPELEVLERSVLFDVTGLSGRFQPASGDSLFMAHDATGPGADARVILVRNWARELAARAEAASERSRTPR